MRARILACLIVFPAASSMADWTCASILGPTGRVAAIGDGGTGAAMD